MPKSSEAREEVEVMILGKALLESETHGFYVSDRFGSRDKASAQVANLVRPLSRRRDRSEECSAFSVVRIKMDLTMHRATEQ